MTFELWFLKIKGGWVNPTSVLWVETSRQNELMLVIGIEGKDKPIYLNETDSATFREYMELHTWESEEEDEYELQEEE